MGTRGEAGRAVRRLQKQSSVLAKVMEHRRGVVLELAQHACGTVAAKVLEALRWEKSILFAIVRALVFIPNMGATGRI